MRRLLDDKVFLENKRIMQLVRSIESGALGTREAPPSGVFMEIAAQSVDVALPFERPLYEPSRRIMVDDAVWQQTMPTWTPAPSSASSMWTPNG